MCINWELSIQRMLSSLLSKKIKERCVNLWIFWKIFSAQSGAGISTAPRICPPRASALFHSLSPPNKPPRLLEDVVKCVYLTTEFCESIINEASSVKLTISLSENLNLYPNYISRNQLGWYLDTVLKICWKYVNIRSLCLHNLKSRKHRLFVTGQK